ncbi:hypothetical protein QE152_g13442 [Popillia japonica]|uniref:Retrotransposon gag domain-containing protein n=1 Tax=Popillia japonica TaxID=7064 RepID=A0AAW1L9X1_POPJA
MLTRLLEKDKLRPGIEFKDPDFDFEIERDAINATISSIKKDKLRPGIEFKDPDFDFEIERDAINATISSIKECINEFEGPESDSAFKRIASRITHVTDRVKRIELTDEEVVTTFKNDSLANCLELEVLLSEKVIRETQPVFTNTPPIQSLHSDIPQTSIVKRTPVYKLNVRFTADGKSDVFSFLERIEELSLSRSIEKRDLFDSAVDLFDGDALLWFRSIKPQVHDWDTLVERLKRDFLPTDYEEFIWEQIRDRHQKKAY